MPLNRYNKEFGGKKGSAAKAMNSMMEEYGMAKGKEVFYATKNKKKSQMKGKGKNPFFGNALPFQIGDGGRWFNDDRPMGQSFCKKG